MLCTALLALSSGAAYALNTIKDVRIVLDGTEDFDYDAFLLDSPNRLVIDLKNATVSGSPKVAKNRLISDFRVGNKPDIKGKRLVFDINNNVNIKKKFTIEKNWRLVIDLSSQGLSDPSPKSNLKNAYSGAVKRKKIVVLDPGHGGKDPGAIGRSYRTYEKNITLAMARELKKILEKDSRYKVYLTRNRDVFIPLRERVRIARRYKADLFLSIHADSALNKNAKGLSVYTLSETASDKEAAALAERENKADVIAGLNFAEHSKEVSDILINLAQRETMNRSSEFANFMVQEMRKSVKLLDNTHRFAGFAVLKAPDVPAVLLEMGYLSNRTEEKLLRQESYRRKLAKSASAAIDRYFENMQHASLF